MSKVHSYGPCTATCSRGANTTTGPCTATYSCEAKYNNRSLHCHLQSRIQLPLVLALPLAAVEPGTQQVLALPLAAVEPTTSGPCTATCSRGARYTYYRSLHCY